MARTPMYGIPGQRGGIPFPVPLEPESSHVGDRGGPRWGPRGITTGVSCLFSMLCCVGVCTTFALDSRLKDYVADGPNHILIREFAFGAKRPDVRCRCGTGDSVRRPPKQTTSVFRCSTYFCPWYVYER